MGNKPSVSGMSVLVWAVMKRVNNNYKSEKIWAHINMKVLI